MWTVSAIGETAGQVWQILSSRGRCNLSALKREIEAPQSLVDMAIGWLAREGKIEVIQEKRAIQLSLKKE